MFSIAALALITVLGAALPDAAPAEKPPAPGAASVSGPPAAPIRDAGRTIQGDAPAAPHGPTSQGYQRPPKVFEKVTPGQVVQGSVTKGDGAVASGEVSTKYGKPLTIFDRAKKRFIDIQIPDVSRIDVAIEEEHEEPFWYWKESGSDVKVYTGKTYPWRKYLTTVTLRDGTKLEGDLAGPIYIKDADGKETQLILYKRQKGDEGQKLSDLSYVKSIVLAPQPAGAPGPAAKGQRPEDRRPEDQRPQTSTASDGPAVP